MKNVFLLPTDKSSVLYKRNDLGKFYLGSFDICVPGDKLRTNQHIYITNSEEIEEGDWFITTDTNEIDKSDWVKFNFNNGKKIILTSDPELIENGVQAIDDEFLDWFVQNPSCKFVQVDTYSKKIGIETDANGYREMDVFVSDYKIIIPKEEPKRKIDTCYNFDMEIGCVQDICRCEQEEPKQECTCGVCDYCEEQESIQILKKAKENALKQETLEEAAEKEFPLVDTEWCRTGAAEEENLHLLGHRKSFIKGAKWQAERMYSEEEVLELLLKG